LGPGSVAKFAGASRLFDLKDCDHFSRDPPNQAKFIEFFDGPRFVSKQTMGRGRRVLYEGAIYHVMSRGNRRKRIFLDDDDRLHFLELLGEAHQRYNFRWRSFALMGSHYHAEVQTPFGNLSEGMHHVNGEYAKAWNRRHRTSGHLFGGPYRAIPIEDGRYALTALKYVAWNPVDAGYVKHPLDWPWSNCRATAGLAPAPDFLDLDWMPGFFGRPNLAEAQQQYLATISEPLTCAQSEEYLNTLVVGSEDFKEDVRRQIGMTMYDVMVPRSYRRLARPTLGELFLNASSDLEERNRLILRAQVVHGYRQFEVARTLNLHPNTVSKIVSRLKKQKFFLMRVS
jgi:putative transposase